ATDCETHLRVWLRAGAAGLAPALADGPWEEGPPEALPDRPDLPALVLHGSGTGLRLGLRLDDAGATEAGVLGTRALGQVRPAEAGGQGYRARFLLRGLGPGPLDVELPAAPAALNLELLLDDKRLTVWQPTPDADDGGRTVRLRPEAEGGRFPRVLEVRYQLPAWRVEGGARLGRWELAALPPRLRGAVYVGPVRWHVGLPAGQTALAFAAAQPEWQWQWGNRPPGPQAARAAPGRAGWV